jgi:hypothetical protein
MKSAIAVPFAKCRWLFQNLTYCGQTKIPAASIASGACGKRNRCFAYHLDRSIRLTYK